MAITRYGLTGPMTAYGTFQAKTAESVLGVVPDYVVRVQADNIVVNVSADDVVVFVPADDRSVQS